MQDVSALKYCKNSNVNVTQKIRSPLTKPAAREIVRDYGSWVHSETTPGAVISSFGD
jgi:hypothetical protein